MSVKPLRVLQWNVGKRRAAQLSLLNDEETNDFDLLLLTEPYRFTPEGHSRPLVTQHHQWSAVLPTMFVTALYQPFNFRSMIYVNKRIQARQIAVESADITAVSIKVREDVYLIVSVYVPRIRTMPDNLRILEHNLEIIQQLYDKALRQQPNLYLIVAGDFNRHDRLWGGSQANIIREGEAEPILNFIVRNQLHSTLPKGTITYENEGSNQRSTIDLMFVSKALANRIMSCQPHHTDHGSDHKAIATCVDSQQPIRPLDSKRRTYHMADWEQIRGALKPRLIHLRPIESATQLDQYAEDLNNVVQDTIQDNIPPSKPMPYAKRWWSMELTQLRKEYNYRRNQWTSARRRGEDSFHIRDAAQVARRQYLFTIEKQKRDHWNDFLKDTKNVWKALSYANQEDKVWNIPVLHRGEDIAETEELKASMLMQAFFPPQPEPVGSRDNIDFEPEGSAADMIHTPVLEEEVRHAIFSSNPRKAPGSDDLPFKVWQELWPIVKGCVTHLYQSSLILGHVPLSWRHAKIVVIRKPGKPDYTIPRAYRPISLLKTISKGLEKVVARRMSEYLERRSLLPSTQFGARPCRSTEHALMLLVEKIYDAWRG
ncbi:MAG: endonuclease/exonuclease/phosphatase family protein, partial [Ktedonobacteraceae bacterium]